MTYGQLYYSHLQKDIFIFSIGSFEKLLLMKFVGHAVFLSKFPHISAPYKHTCLTVLSNNLSASLRENHAEGSTWKVLNLVFFHHNSML